MKKILSLFLALIMTVTIFNGITVSAAAEVASGSVVVTMLPGHLIVMVC